MDIPSLSSSISSLSVSTSSVNFSFGFESENEELQNLVHNLKVSVGDSPPLRDVPRIVLRPFLRLKIIAQCKRKFDIVRLASDYVREFCPSGGQNFLSQRR